MAAGPGQPQKRRLSAVPQPCGQPGGGQRRSPSGYAWQVEVVAGKLVIAANRLMGKELDGGARCRLRKATANQITALRYISEAVGVKSFEKATTKLWEDLDTPALAEALRTAEMRLQISEQRVAALEASLTRQQNLRMHGEVIRAIDILAGGAAANDSYRKVFMRYSGAERQATLREPYLNAGYYVQNLRQFVCELEQHSQVRKLDIVMYVRSGNPLDQLERLKAEQKHVEIEYQFSTTLRQRELVLGSRHVVVCDRGLNMFTKMRRSMRGTRPCRVLYFEVHGDANAAERGVNVEVSAPVTPLVRSQEGRQLHWRTRGDGASAGAQIRERCQ